MKRMLTALIALLWLTACSLPLETVSVEKMAEDEGRFNLIYLVGQKREDVRNAVILDRLGDDYRFMPEVRDFEYEILQDISITEAVLETNIFFRSFPFINGGRFMGISDGKGNIIGYEFKPYYAERLYGTRDVLNIDYSLKNDYRIFIDIGIKLNLIRVGKVDEY